MTAPQQPDYRALLTRSLLAVEKLEKQLASLENAKHEPIAVVGMACRFPGGANDIQSFWSLLSSARDAVTEVPPDRWDADVNFDPDPDAVGKSYSRWGGFIDQVTDFDASFFGISPREAVTLDPQQRLLLEIAWEALEDASIAPLSLSGTSASVFIGISANDYALMLGEHLGTTGGDAYTASGTSHSIASGRISYFFGLQGPNFAVDTACSSSVVAVHNAITALRNNETNVALAGGVSLVLSEHGVILTSRARMMSFDGRCKTFDESADGYVRGEGCGMLVLKRLSDAERNGDRVLAVLRGSAINQDGRSSGLTAPNGIAQESVLRAALSNAKLAPHDIDVIEAHGTGTPLGDPIEMNALGNVYGQRSAETPLLVGSVKTNIGHLEAASGIAGMIKVILSLQHEVLPAHLHLNNPNSRILWDTLPVRIPTKTTAWPARDGHVRRAGVSSFGFSGTNSHVIIEEAPRKQHVASASDETRDQVLVLAAQTPASLQKLARDYSALLSGINAPALRDVAATAASGRSHLTERLAIVARTPAEAASLLDQFVADPETRTVTRGRFVAGNARETAFLFTGQGAQYPGMARELYESEPVFKAALDRCVSIVDPLLDAPLLPLILGTANDSERLHDTAFTQPALFAVEFALATLWKSWGIEPTVVMGHSVGEYVAACLAGVFSLEDGLRLIAARARLMSALPRDGSMAAVFATRERVAQALVGHQQYVDIAAVNGPENVVISGRRDIVESVLKQLSGEGIDSAPLNVSHAFHSPLMEPMLDEFERVAQTVRFSVPTIGLISNVSGKMAGAEVASAAYWRRHVRAAVLFADSIATIHDEKIRTFLEVGPNAVLVGMGRRCPRAGDATWMHSIVRARGDRRSMLETVAKLHTQGYALQWKAVSDPSAQIVDLPKYPFERERYWFDTMKRPELSASLSGKDTGHPLLGQRIESPIALFQHTLSINGTPWIGDHRIYGNALLPAAAFVELAMAAAREVLQSDDVALTNVSVLAGLTVPEQGGIPMQVVVTPAGNDEQLVQVFSRAEDDQHNDDAPWVLHATATASRTSAAPAKGVRSLPDPSPRLRDVTAYYEKLRDQGASYGPAFRVLTSIASSNGSMLGKLSLPKELRDSHNAYALHPVMVDAAIQLIGVGLPWADDPRSEDDICLPVGMQQFRVFRTAAADVWCFIESLRITGDNNNIRCDVLLTDDDGSVVAEIVGMEMQRVTRASLLKQSARSDARDWLLQVDWQEQAVEEVATADHGQWLVVSNNAASAVELARVLTARGAHAQTLVAGEHFERNDAGWRMNLQDASHYTRALSEIETPYTLKGIVFMMHGETAGADADAHNFQSAHRQQIETLLAALPSISNTTARLVLTTRGTQSVDGSIPNLLDAPQWGLSNVIAAEYPGLRVTRIDLDARPGTGEAERLARSLLTDSDETRIALRGSKRLVARLASATLQSEPTTIAQRLEITERGALSNLALLPVARPAPGEGEIEIRVYATGLNFRDVLNALGMYPGDAGALGNECAGVVTAVGVGVTDFAIGDEVVSMVDRSFATYTIAIANQTVRKPGNLSFAEAATIPVTFLTAEYALATLGHIRSGNKILVHAATGGVGMAAIQLARRAGAIVFGTAGSNEKRALATSLGATHMSDSRSLRFVDDFKHVDGFDGFDIAINSLAGDFIPASLGLMKRGGHFVEIGKTGIWDAATVDASYPGVNYHPLYLGEVTAERPLFMRDMLQRLMDDFASGALKPLPLKLYSLNDAESAFRFMSQGLHTGKIVIEQARVPELRSNATYLVTGGLGGLGLLSARMLADLGARNIVLLGRRAPSNEALQQIAGMREADVNVEVRACDIANENDVQRVFSDIEATLPPLRGVLHVAGVVDDGMLAEQTMSRFEHVMAPKVQGSWNLHKLGASLPLDFFVMFSSGAALLGSPGQSNYAAANSFLDALAYVRRAQGRHALSINWGSWSEVGMAANVDEQHQRRWTALGLRMIAPADGVRMLRELLFAAPAPNVAALPLVKARLPRNAGPFFQRLVVAQKSAAGAAESSANVLAQLSDSEAEARLPIVMDFVIEQVTRILALSSANRLRPDQSLMDIGMDSLTAMELRNRVQSVLRVRLAVGELLQGPTIEELSAQILSEVALSDNVPVPAAAAGQSDWEEGSL